MNIIDLSLYTCFEHISPQIMLLSLYSHQLNAKMSLYCATHYHYSVIYCYDFESKMSYEYLVHSTFVLVIGFLYPLCISSVTFTFLNKCCNHLNDII